MRGQIDKRSGETAADAGMRSIKRAPVELRGEVSGQERAFDTGTRDRIFAADQRRAGDAALQACSWGIAQLLGN